MRRKDGIVINSLFALSFALFVVVLILVLIQGSRSRQTARTEDAFLQLQIASDLVKSISWSYDSTRINDAYFTSDGKEISYPVSKFYVETSDHQDEIRQAVEQKVKSGSRETATFKFMLKENAIKKVRDYILKKESTLSYPDLVRIEYRDQ